MSPQRNWKSERASIFQYLVTENIIIHVYGLAKSQGHGTRFSMRWFVLNAFFQEEIETSVSTQERCGNDITPALTIKKLKKIDNYLRRWQKN